MQTKSILYTTSMNIGVNLNDEWMNLNGNDDLLPAYIVKGDLEFRLRLDVYSGGSEIVGL